MEDTYMAPFRTIANERWRPGHVPGSSQEVCRRLGILDFRETVCMQRLRLAERLVNASPSLMALLQSDAGRDWKAELFCDIELLRREKGPQLVEVEGLSDFEKLWCDFPKAWKLLVSSCQRKLVERRQRSEPAKPALVSVLPTLSCDECEAVCSGPFGQHQMRAHQRRRERRRHVLESIRPYARRISVRDRWSFSIWRWERSGAFWHGNLERSSRFRMTRWQLPTSRIARTGDSASGKDEAIWRGHQC